MWNLIERTNIIRTGIIVSICFLNSSIGLPVEEPTRFSLSTVVESSSTASTVEMSRWDLGRETLGGVADAIRIATGRLVNSVTLARNILIDRMETLTSESQNVISVASANFEPLDSRGIKNPPVINTRPNARETVRLETDAEQSLLERPISKPILGVLEAFEKPTPIVDGIREEEKYGNNGDKFIGIGRALVNGYEGFSNFLNAVVDFPRTKFRNASRGITEALNNVGARLVGLE